MSIKQPVIVVEAFKDVAGKVSCALTEQLKCVNNTITGVHYEHGHPLEIIETLAQKDKSNNLMFDKYPMIGLFQDFNENVTGKVGAPVEVTLNLIIAAATKPDYKANERYKYNFKPVLYPIYQRLMFEIGQSGYFLTYGYDNIPHTKIDRLYWGTQGLYGNTGNIFNDYLDAIEIRNLKLNLYSKTC